MDDFPLPINPISTRLMGNRNCASVVSRFGDIDFVSLCGPIPRVNCSAHVCEERGKIQGDGPT